MDRDHNPFTPGAGSRQPAIVGRDDEIQAFRTAVRRLGRGEHARSLILSGLRGVGKTVLLNEFELAAKEAGWITSRPVECNEDDQLGPLILKLAQRSLRSLSRGRRMSDALKRATGALTSFAVTVDETGKLRFTIEPLAGVADSGDLAEDITELFHELGNAATERGSGVLFLLDEMQFLAKHDLATLAEAFHAVSQQNTPILLVGAGLPQLPLALTNAKPYTERLFTYQTIDRLPAPAAKQALELPARRNGATFRPDALDRVLEITDGYPYFLQQWGDTLWSNADDDVFSLEDVQEAEEVVNDELDRRFFRDRYERATEAERIYMAAMADLGDGAHSSAQIATHLHMAQNQLSVRRDGLIKKGLVYSPVDSDLDFTVPQFAQFIRRTHPFDPTERPTRGRKPKSGPTT